MKIKNTKFTESGQDGYYGFVCPGCNSDHIIPLAKGKETKVAWGWNGSVDMPTITPSILVNKGSANPLLPICHSYVTDGKIKFLADSKHALVGQTIEMADIK